jgi:RNA polymerase sigma-70 factor, ECF subfamily
MVTAKQNRFLALYEPIHDRFERFCRARVYGEMEYTDLMNETLLVAFEKLDSLKSDRSFLSYLFSIAVRLLANDKRKMRPERIDIGACLWIGFNGALHGSGIVAPRLG